MTGADFLLIFAFTHAAIVWRISAGLEFTYILRGDTPVFLLKWEELVGVEHDAKLPHPFNLVDN